MQLSKLEIQRREALQKIKDLGIKPYPSELFEINVNAKDIHKNYEKRKNDYKNVSIAGRIMSRRIMGSASFFEIQDQTGRIQVYINRDDICPGEDKTLYNTLFKKLLDIGDFVGIKGFVFTTQMGEITIHAQEYKLLTKSLKPLPMPRVVKDEEGNEKKYDAFTDPETRYRQRYADMVVNPEVRDVFIKRTKMVNVMKEYLNNRNCLEVETPILQPVYGGASARPFTTHHNALDTKLYMRIANELYLKRLVVGGFERVYEFSKDFRNEGMSRFHNPEFTQVELYVAYRDYYWMMDLVEEMVEKVATELHGDTTIQVGENEINFQRPWKRYTMFEAIEEYNGIDISNMDEAELRATAEKLNVPIDESMGKGKLIDEIFGETVEHKLIQPTFITDYPVEMSPLAKKHRDKEGLVERFEVICNGKEIANSFSELNDPIEQRKRFEEQIELGKRGDDEAMVLDEDFLRALEYGMPPTAGLGIGIDRLSMIMTNQPSIQDVLFFPAMKPEKWATEDANAAYSAVGVPEVWIPVLKQIGFTTVAGLKEVKATKLFNDLGGQRKKLKIEEKIPSVEEISAWQEA